MRPSLPIAAGWWRRLALSLVPVPVGADAEPAPREVGEQLHWLVRLRWIAIGGQLGVVVPALRAGWLSRANLPPYLLMVAVLIFFNFLCIGRFASATPPRNSEVFGHLVVDLFALAVLLMLSGGAWNPLSPILYIHAGLGALLLPGWRSVGLAGLMVGVACAISLYPDLPPAVPSPRTPIAVVLPSQILVVAILWGLTAWLAASLTGQRRLVQNLREHQQRVDRLRAAGALAAGFSHEFSTPLATLRLRLDRLARGKVPPEDPDLQAARDAAARCEEVLRSMVGRQLDPNELRLEAVDVPSLVRRTCQSWSVSGRHATVESSGGGTHPCLLPPLPFAQALLDLLDNAWEAGLATSARGEVTVRIDCEGGDYRVEVLDRGPGWPLVVRENLGQPFVTTKEHGHGLGLYNAHSLAVALGGTLRLLDRDGGGAVASIVLPCERCAPGDSR